MLKIRIKPEAAEWLDGVSDPRARARILGDIQKLKHGIGAVGDVKTVGDKLLEMRIHYGQGFRVYMTLQDGVLILLIGEKKSQKRDIKKALDLLNNVTTPSG